MTCSNSKPLKILTTFFKRVDYEAEYFEWDAIDDEGSESETLIEDSDEE